MEQQKGIGSVDAGQHGRALDHGKHLMGHFHDNLVGVAVSEEARERTAPGHAIAPGVVNYDQVYAARLLAFGGEAGAGTGGERVVDRDVAIVNGQRCGDEWVVGEEGSIRR